MTGASATGRDGDIVRIRVLAGGPRLADRVTLSAGSARASAGVDQGVVPYGDGAFVPIAPWRKASAQELAHLEAPARARDEDDDVLVLDVAALVAAVRGTLGDATSDCDLRVASSSPAFAAALGDSVAAIAEYCRDSSGLAYVGAAVAQPGLRTVTIDGGRRPLERTGLHVDSWDGGAAGARARSRRRLCVNAGREPRYLLFVPRRVSSLAAEAARVGAPVNAIASELLSSRPDLPIVRVRVDPGEAYVASTEDLIHDGSTEGAREPDLALHFIGHFGAPDSDAATAE